MASSASTSGVKFEAPPPVAVLVLIFGLLTLRFLESQWRISDEAQQLCLQSLAGTEGFTPALLCGISLDSPLTRESLQQWGLIHLFVVSGAHFLFLEHQLNRPVLKKVPRSLKVLLLTVFAFATGLGPPVLRASLVLLLKFLNRKVHFNWNSAQILLFAGLLCVFYFPTHRHFSLQLSWAAALLISIPVPQHPAGLLKNALMWFGLLPLLLGLQWPHPLSIVANSLILPLFQIVLFPLVWIDQSLFQGWGSSRLHPHTLSFSFGLSFISPPSSDSSMKWIYVALLQTLALFLSKKRLQ